MSETLRLEPLIPGISAEEVEIINNGAARFIERFGGDDDLNVVLSQLNTLTLPATADIAGQTSLRRAKYDPWDDGTNPPVHNCT